MADSNSIRTPTGAPNGGQAAPLDVDAQRLGSVYAQALLGAATQAGHGATVVEEFDSLVVDVLDRFPDFEAVLRSGIVPVHEKIALLERTLGGQASPVVLNFLKVLAENERLDVLRAVRGELHRQWDEQRGMVGIEVTTAAPVDAALAQRLTDRLRAMFQAEPHITWLTNPQLIGGILLRVGDTVYDGSLATRLGRLREQIIDRSIHEIQSRRDRFSHSA